MVCVCVCVRCVRWCVFVCVRWCVCVCVLFFITLSFRSAIAPSVAPPRCITRHSLTDHSPMAHQVDAENGWTPLHRAVYFGHLEVRTTHLYHPHIPPSCHHPLYRPPLPPTIPPNVTTHPLPPHHATPPHIYFIYFGLPQGMNSPNADLSAKGSIP